MSAAPVEVLSARIRAALGSGHVREVRMFGANCFLVDGAMAVAARNDGSLLVHVAPETGAASLHDPHVARAEMGAGRSMGPGWSRVDPAALTEDAAIHGWIAAALQRSRRA